MTWGEAKLAALQLIFSNEGPILRADDTNQEYLDAMPSAANAGLSLIEDVLYCLHLLEIRMDPRAEQEERTEEVAENGGGMKTTILTVPVHGSGEARVELAHCCTAFRALSDQDILERNQEGRWSAVGTWRVEGRSTLVLPAAPGKVYRIYYRAYPGKITLATPDEEVLDLPREGAELLPLYLGSQVYRDDDIQLATQLRNEFEDGLSRLAQDLWVRPRCGGGTVRNTTGWW